MLFVFLAAALVGALTVLVDAHSGYGTGPFSAAENAVRYLSSWTSSELAMTWTDRESPALRCSSPPRDDVSTAVVEAISAVTGDPIEHLPALTTAIDPDVLDTFVAARSPGTVSISFTYAGHDVTVRENGAVTINPAVA